jgi:hypothetical protein
MHGGKFGKVVVVTGQGWCGRSVMWSPTAPPSVLSDISPTSGEIANLQLFWLAQTWRLAANGGAPISPLVGEMSDRTEGGAVECKFCRITLIFVPTPKPAGFAKPTPFSPKL